MEIEKLKIIPYYEDSKMVGLTIIAPPGYRFDISNSEEIDLVLWNCEAVNKLKSQEDEHNKKTDRG